MSSTHIKRALQDAQSHTTEKSFAPCWGRIKIEIMKLTATQIDTELRRLMQEQPTFRYNKSEGLGICHYNKEQNSDPEPNNGCIFGQALQALGIPKERLTSTMTIRELGVKELPAQEDRPRYWETIQSDQDSGVEWGKLEWLMPECPQSHEDGVSRVASETGGQQSESNQTLSESNTGSYVMSQKG